MQQDSLKSSVVFTLLGRLANVLSGALIGILLARHYGVEVYGQWAAASVYAMMVANVVEGGLSNTLMRDVSRDKSKAGQALGLALKGRAVLGAIAVPVALLAAWWQTGNEGFKLALTLQLVLTRFIEGAFSGWHAVLVALGRYRLTNTLEILRRVGLLIVAAALVAADFSIQWVAASGLAITVITGLIIYWRSLPWVKPTFERSVVEGWQSAFWFWISGVLYWVNGEVDQLMLSSMAGDAATGIYSAAYRAAMLFQIVPYVLAYVVSPKLYRSTQDGVGLHRHLNGSMLVLSALGIFVGLETWWHAGPISDLAYGAKYAASAPVLQAYGVYLFLAYVRTPASWFVATSDRLRLTTLFYAICALSNIALNLVLIPRMGPEGSAWATVASEAILLVLMLGTTVRFVDVRTAWALLIGASSGLVVVALHRLTVSLPTWYASAVVDGVVVMLLYAGLVRAVLRGWDPLGLLSARSSARA
ncbi:MAG: flippase [Myxococcota bacterium]